MQSSARYFSELDNTYIGGVKCNVIEATVFISKKIHD